MEILSESNSPDGKSLVTLFSYSGGGAAGYTYANVNLREASETLNSRDFLLGKYLWRRFADILATWKDSKTLEVHYRWASDHPAPKTKNEQTVPKKGKVTIHYRIKENDEPAL